MTEEKLTWWATAVFAAMATGALAVPALRIPAAVVAGLLWFAGGVLMIAALVIGARRSRTEVVDIAGLFFTHAPIRMRLALGAQTAIAFATALARPNTSAAFGILAPISVLGLMGLWGARHGAFPARQV